MNIIKLDEYKKRPVTAVKNEITAHFSRALHQENRDPTFSHNRRFDFMRSASALCLPFWSSENKWCKRGIAATVVALTYAQVQVQLELNHWGPKLYNPLAEMVAKKWHDVPFDFPMDKFIPLSEEFLLIAGCSFAINKIRLRTIRELQIKFRPWLVKKFLDKWIPLLSQHESHIEKKLDNIDSRICSDVLIVANSIELLSCFLYCAALGGSFGRLLWNMPGVTKIHMGHTAYSLPHHHLLYAAAAYAAIYTPIAILSGRSLTKSTALRQESEADFRTAVLLCRKNATKIAADGGEDAVFEKLEKLLKATEEPWRKQARGEVKVLGVATLNGLLAIPITILVTFLTTRVDSFGMGMRTAGACQQVIAALSWPADNITAIAELAASWKRVIQGKSLLNDLSNASASQQTPVIDRNIQNSFPQAMPQLSSTFAWRAPAFMAHKVD